MVRLKCPYADITMGEILHAPSTRASERSEVIGQDGVDWWGLFFKEKIVSIPDQLSNFKEKNMSRHDSWKILTQMSEDIDAFTFGNLSNTRKMSRNLS